VSTLARRLLLGLVLGLGLLAATGVATARTGPELSAHGPTAVSGTEQSAVFRVGSRTVRQVRYDDRGRLGYEFALSNDGRLPVTVEGLAPLRPAPRLFRYLSLTDAGGASRFTIAAGERVTVRLALLMHSCETLSARAGSFVTQVSLRTSRAGVLDSTVTLDLPEHVHTGSPREASCPRATATSRPPG
jgi:hypothetical protein